MTSARMTRSAIGGAPKQAARGPVRPAVDRLSDMQVDAATGLHIGSVDLDGQLLRVGIRPGPAAGPAAGPPLLIFNGIGANLELAGPMMSRLDRIETVIFDVPGAGKSPRPKSPYRLSWLASLARRLLDHLGYGTVDVLGVSWGGGLAQQFTMQYSARVRRQVLAATAMGGTTMLPGNPRVLLKMVNPRRFLDRGYMQRIAPDLYGGSLRHHPEAIRHFTDHARGGDPVGYRYQLLAMIGWTSLPWLWRMRQPTLVLAGDDDPLLPLINARIHARLLPNARLHVLHDGHLFMLTCAQETADIIATFLGEAHASGSA
jgi:poly(3-hydroxyalkanoate) depolymerase